MLGPLLSSSVFVNKEQLEEGKRKLERYRKTTVSYAQYLNNYYSYHIIPYCTISYHMVSIVPYHLSTLAAS